MRSITMSLSSGYSVGLREWSGDGERFAEVFLQTWQRLPESVRVAILRYWDGDDGMPVLLELSNVWQNHKTCLAEVSCRGYEMRFNAAEFEGMPLSVAECTI